MPVNDVKKGKKKKTKKELEGGALGVDEHQLDFLAGADIDVNKLEALPIQDKIYTAVNQDYRPYKTACTMMSSYSVVLSLWNMQENENEKKKIINEAIKRGFNPSGGGRYTRLGVDTVAKVWNKLHPDKKVIYIKAYIGTPEFKILIDKGYGGVFTRFVSNSYFKDMKDGCIENIHSGHPGHAIAGYRGQKCGTIRFVNTYPKTFKKFNIYEDKVIEEEVKKGFMRPGVYFFIKEKDWDKEEILKRKIIGVILGLNKKLLTMNINNTSRAMINQYNDYFKSVGFKPIDILKK